MRFPKLLVVVIAIISAVVAYAGEKANFTGQWTLNQEKSKFDDMGPAFLPATMVVAQIDNELTVQKTFKSDFADDFTAEEKMTLDGQECKSEFWNSPRITTALWTENGDTLTIDSKTKFDMDGETSEMILKEKWTLAEEGNLLLIKHFSSSNFGERKITIAYSKMEAKKDEPAPAAEEKPEEAAKEEQK